MLSGLPKVFKYFVYLSGATAFTFLFPVFQSLTPLQVVVERVLRSLTPLRERLTINDERFYRVQMNDEDYSIN